MGVGMAHVGVGMAHVGEGGYLLAKRVVDTYAIYLAYTLVYAHSCQPRIWHTFGRPQKQGGQRETRALDSLGSQHA